MTTEEWKWAPRKGYAWYITRPLFLMIDLISGRHGKTGGWCG